VLIHLEELQLLAEAALAAAALVPQALQTQTLLEQPVGQDRLHQSLVQALPMLVVAVAVAVLLRVQVEQEDQALGALVDAVPLMGLQVLQIKAVAVAVVG
jgi:hypothetical protein